MIRALRDWRYSRIDRFACHARESWESWNHFRSQIERRYSGRASRSLRILDIGCGRFYPHILLFRNRGYEGIGVDKEPTLLHSLDPVAIRRNLEVTGQGFSGFRLFRTWMRNAYHRWVFYRPLSRSAGLSITWKPVRVLRMGAEHLGFKDRMFDVVISNDAFEHIRDVETSVREVRRVLKPEGIALIGVHLFASMTGGHEPELGYHQVRMPLDRPWSHLYDSDWKAPCELNRLRDRDYMRLFEFAFTSVDRVVLSKFGTEYLSREVSSRLPGYTLDELMTEKVMYILAS